MGSGSYDYISSHARTVNTYAHQSREQIFTSRRMNEELDIKGKIRESCDSDEHPESFPIIIAFDVTGSMGHVPHRLISEDFPDIMKKIMDAGVPNPQICFMAIGDHYTDRAPIQVGQFESSDEILEKWLKMIYLEGAGGGNGGESYLLAWAVASRQTKIDSFNKRGVKGVLITIGDDRTHKNVESNRNAALLGGEGSFTASEVLDEARKKYDVFHINVCDYLGNMAQVRDHWAELLGPNAIDTETEDGADIKNIIPKIVIKCYNKHCGKFGDAYPASEHNDPVKIPAEIDSETPDALQMMAFAAMMQSKNA